MYDATKYLPLHPGGEASILITAGQDCTEDFEALHSSKAWKLLDEYYIGELAGAKPAGGFDFITLMILGVLLALIVSTILGGRREKKKYEQMMASIKKNDQVRTAGGIIGSVVEVKPDVIVLKIDENSNTKITVARGKIEAVMKETSTS